MKAVFLDFATMGSDTLDPAPLTALFPDLSLFDSTPAEMTGARVQDAELVFVNKVRITRDIIEASESLRFVGLTATGTDNVDLEAARDRGVAVCNIRAYCTQSVVEHVFGALLCLSHSLRSYDASVRRGDWARADNFCMLGYPIRELSAMTIGIIGYGELGRSVARMAERFGMRVLVAQRPETGVNDPILAGDGRVDLDELLEAADVISLHCPLTEATRTVIDKAAIRRMKPGAILINTARGALVDTAALAQALAEGRIAAAAVDVLPEEPPVSGDPLLDYDGDNLILTPHIAWGTQEARQTAIDELAANVEAFLDGEERNRVV